MTTCSKQELPIASVRSKPRSDTVVGGCAPSTRGRRNSVGTGRAETSTSRQERIKVGPEAQSGTCRSRSSSRRLHAWPSLSCTAGASKGAAQLRRRRTKREQEGVLLIMPSACGPRPPNTRTHGHLLTSYFQLAQLATFTPPYRHARTLNPQTNRSTNGGGAGGSASTAATAASGPRPNLTGGR